MTDKGRNRSVDLNGDVGEGYGVYRLGDDTLFDGITSANIACGFHAGDPAIMRETVRLALQKGVAIGAHPGLPDRLGFGRRAIEITPREAWEMVVYQIGALWAFVQAEGGRLRHVKPHGALYNMAAKDERLAEAIAEAVYAVNPELRLYGLAGSVSMTSAERVGLRTASEVFADRAYLSDGSLVPRSEPVALLTDVEAAAERVVRMVNEGKVRSREGEEIVIRADTVCLHGDGPHALQLARRIRQKLMDAGIDVAAPDGP